MPFGIIDCSLRDGKLLPGSEQLVKTSLGPAHIEADAADVPNLKRVTYKVADDTPLSLQAAVSG